MKADISNFVTSSVRVLIRYMKPTFYRIFTKLIMRPFIKRLGRAFETLRPTFENLDRAFETLGQAFEGLRESLKLG